MDYMKSLSVSDAFSFAWDKFHKHTGISVGFTIAYFLIGYAIQVTPRVVDAIVANSSPLVYSIILTVQWCQFGGCVCTVLCVV